jgi:hypothetical protein
MGKAYKARRRKLKAHTFGGSDRHSRGAQAHRKAQRASEAHRRELSERHRDGKPEARAGL